MRHEWIECAIQDQVLLQRGFDITRSQQRPGTVPVISSAGVSSYHDRAMVSGPGVVLGRKGVVGSVHYSSRDFWPHDTTLWVKDFKGNLPHFVFYFFRWFAPRLAALDVGSANPTLNRNHVHPIRILWPPLEEQEQISALLGNLDERIELLQNADITLEAMARAIFKSWFVDFDPVRAKAEGREPEGMDAATAALFPSDFQNSELGPIPRVWGVTTLGDYSSLNPESWSRSTRPSRLRYVDLANTKWGRIEAVADYEQGEAPSRAQRVLRKGDSIIGTVRPGNGSYALIGDEGLTGSTGFAVLRPKDPHLASFVYLSATEWRNIDRLSSLADGGAYPAVRPEVVISTTVVSPPREVLESFGNITMPLLWRIEASEKQIRTLSDLRDTLLPRLISGKLRVPEAEGMLAEAL